jgi:predicted HicB family RNase H-like nuclease
MDAAQFLCSGHLAAFFCGDAKILGTASGKARNCKQCKHIGAGLCPWLYSFGEFAAVGAAWSHCHLGKRKDPAMEVTVIPPTTPAPVLNQEERSQTVCRIANETFGKTKYWVDFFREILGVNGLVRRLYPTPEELAAFEKTSEYADIQKLVKRLRDKPTSQSEGQEITRVITVRLPNSLHESLKAEAHDRNTSINQLCITKLLQVMEDEEGAEEAA